MRVDEDSSPWGHRDFTDNKAENQTSAYNWGDPDSDDFFSNFSGKKVRLLDRIIQSMTM